MLVIDAGEEVNVNLFFTYRPCRNNSFSGLIFQVSAPITLKRSLGSKMSIVLALSNPHRVGLLTVGNDSGGRQAEFR
jgi:hypothetical protein